MSMQGRQKTDRRSLGAFLRDDSGLGGDILNTIFWVALAAIIMGGTVGLFMMARGSTASLISASGAFDIQSGVHETSSLGNYGSGDLTSALIQAKAVPSNMIVPGNSTTLQGPTGVSYYTVTGNVTTFSITLSGLTDSECMKIAEQSTTGNSWLSVAINGSTVMQPATLQMVQGACSGGTNSITWVSD
ncbi:type 4 pilus major pilin [Leptospirillum ferriphilum]|uniref:type 4 pilus major pilin n=1 Tax=Leptospirillum ferriphilum TaxID=178606 RepID=UPI0009CD0609|nr:type 4 pilus major pilin [Leptospirillum ferriphilum]OOH76346.1 hypothetical protein BOX30_10650 [Leptospirillum ferriphilum]